jgi:hypothetical protein
LRLIGRIVKVNMADPRTVILTMEYKVRGQRVGELVCISAIHRKAELFIRDKTHDSFMINEQIKNPPETDDQGLKEEEV